MDELFRVPPAEFVAARDALAKELRAAGDKAGAAEVKALRRPTVGAWAVNQVAREEPELVDGVIEAGAAVRGAHEALLAGGEAADLRAATAARRDAVRAATKAAVARAGTAHRDRIAATFDAAAADDDAAAAVRAGRLAKELDPPSGFALVDVGSAVPGPDEDEPGDDDEIDERELDAARARAEAAADAAASARQRADEAQAKRRALEEELAVAAADADEAERAAADSATEAEAAVQEVRRLGGR